MFESTPVSVLIFLPTITAIFVLFSNEDNPQNAKLVGLWGSFIALVLSFIILFNFDFSKNTIQYVNECQWFPTYNIKYKVGVDKFSMPLMCMTSVISFLSILWLFSVNIDKTKHFLVSILLCETAAIGTFAAYDLFLLLFFMESIMIPIFIMIYSDNKRYSRHAAFQFLFYSMASAICMIISFIMIYNSNGTSDLIKIYEHGQFGSPICFWILFMGIAIKVPIFPFHSWVPRVHSDSPTVCSVILGAIALKFAAIVVIKVLYHVFFDELARFSSVITAICLASSVIACAHLFIQDDLKKFFAYFTVLHMNLYMFILLSGTGIKNFVFAIIYHSFMIAVLFFVSDVVKMALGTRKISDLRSINSQLVIVRRVIVIAILMLIGCPFTWGFFIEIITMYSAYKISSILVAGSGLVILVSSARAFLTYYGVFGSWKENNSIPANQTDNPFTYGVSREIVLAVLFGTILFFGFTPHLFLESIK